MYVLGTAGHVDHGKSTLIQALTGIDPDRLAEEKARGLTIDLGFAWLMLPSGREVGIIDVPGHERFVHNMLAGVGSIDATIFVVAANEGWMPQSEEHLQILDLLGARGGVVALTKVDAVDPDTVELAREEITARLAGTALEGAHLVALSAKTGDGLQALRAELDVLLDRTPEAPDERRPRLFVDRAFTIKGSGTVVTGTLTGGAIELEDEVEVQPSGVRARVRGIQTHRRGRRRAEPVSRVALNLAGLERHEVARGDAVVKPGQWISTSALGVRLRTVRSLAHPLTPRGAFKLYVGAAETDARLVLLDAERLRPGEEALAKLALGHAVVATEGDRFVLRDTGRRETVAGGEILDAHLEREAHDATLGRLRARSGAGPGDLPALILAERGVIGNAQALPLTGRAAPSRAVRLRSYVADPARLEQITGSIEGVLRTFHTDQPLAKGMPRDEARRRAGIEDAQLFAEVIDHAAGSIAGEGPLLRLVEHAVRLSPEQQRKREAVLQEAAGFAPPPLAALERNHGPALLRALLDAGDLVKIGALAFTLPSLERAKEAIAKAVADEGPLTTSRIREVLGTSRKYAIPLLEYLDATGFTRRDGDVRSLR